MLGSLLYLWGKQFRYPFQQTNRFAMRGFLVSLLLSLLFVVSTVPAGYAQCPMCRANVEANLRANQENAKGRSLNAGILYLLALPYVLTTAVGYYYWRSYRRNKQAAALRAQAEQNETTEV